MSYGLKILLVVFALGQFACVESMADWAVDIERWRSQLEEKRVKVGDIEVVYLEGGSGPTVLMVHGFAGEKEHWTRFARKLTDHYHVIAVDLPGFGESSRIEGLSYAPKVQAERVEELRVALGIDTWHLVGNSMGGMIAGAYAQMYPRPTLSLTLIDTGGVKSPEESDLAHELRQGRNPLVVESREDMDKLLAFSFVNPPYIPGPVITHAYEKNKAYSDWNRRIFSELMDNGKVVEDALPSIHVPILVMWGDKDKVIHVSTTQTIKKIKPEAEIKILENCGHAPMIELVDESSEIYLEFLARRFLRRSAAL